MQDDRRKAHRADAAASEDGPQPGVPWEEQVYPERWSVDQPPSLHVSDNQLAQLDLDALESSLKGFWRQLLWQSRGVRYFAALSRYYKNRDFRRFSAGYGRLYWSRCGQRNASEACARLEREYWKRLQSDRNMSPEQAQAHMQRERLANDAAGCMELVHQSIAEELDKRLAARTAPAQECADLLHEAGICAAEAAYCRDMEGRCRDLLSNAIYLDTYGRQPEGQLIPWRDAGDGGAKLDPARAQALEDATQEKKGDARWLEDSARWMKDWAKYQSVTDSLSGRRAEAISVQLERDAGRLRQEIDRDEVRLDAFYRHSREHASGESASAGVNLSMPDDMEDLPCSSPTAFIMRGTDAPETSEAVDTARRANQLSDQSRESQTRENQTIEPRTGEDAPFPNDRDAQLTELEFDGIVPPKKNPFGSLHADPFGRRRRR